MCTAYDARIKIFCQFLARTRPEKNVPTYKLQLWSKLDEKLLVKFVLFYSLREDHCLNFVLKPTKICYEFDGVKPENLDFEGALGLDEKMTDTMKAFQIPFIHSFI